MKGNTHFTGTISIPSSTNSVSTVIAGWRYVKNLLLAAMFWFGFGFQVIPIVKGSKIPAVKWDPWLDDLDAKKVHDYWTRHPDHELGLIVGDDTIVFDADSPKSIYFLKQIEDRFDMTPKMVVKTKKGEHHYYRCAAGTIAKSDSHSSEKYPDRLDIKTGRAMVVLPLSTGKTIKTLTVESKYHLSEATQVFIDAICKHNGRTAPSEPITKIPPTPREADRISRPKLEALLDKIDPDGGYEDWVRIGMAIFHETQGSEDGLTIFDRWSSKGNKYKGIKDIEVKWRSFRLGVSNPVTIATLIKMAGGVDADVSDINGNDSFEYCETEVINPAPADATVQTTSGKNPLAKYYLRDIAGLEKNAVAQVQILGNIALLGQATVLYAKQNTGKTLLIIHLITEGIKAGKFDPKKLVFLNMDDDSSGLAEKARIAEEYGFPMVAEGYHGFVSKEFRVAMEKMIATNKAKGVIVILDTLKKFVNTMNKKKSSDFAKVVRRFVLKGGTVIALAHANKHPGSDGKTVYTGTTDIIDDFDCGYTLTALDQDSDSGMKTVEFENIKRRGNVALSASYRYAIESDISYQELLLSVQEVDEMELIPLKQAAEVKSDAEVIASIEACVKEGISTKMILVTEAAQRSKTSKRATLKVIDKYTGEDPAIHRWSFTVGERGAKSYRLLERPSEPPRSPATITP